MSKGLDWHPNRFLSLVIGTAALQFHVVTDLTVWKVNFNAVTYTQKLSYTQTHRSFTHSQKVPQQKLTLLLIYLVSTHCFSPRRAGYSPIPKGSCTQLGEGMARI